MSARQGRISFTVEELEEVGFAPGAYLCYTSFRKFGSRYLASDTQLTFPTDHPSHSG